MNKNLVVDSTNISLNDIESVSFAENIDKETLINVLEQIYKYELEKEINIVINAKHLAFDLKISLFEHALIYDNLINSVVILNIFNLIKGYNTFEDSYFELDVTYFNSLEEFLDIKISLNRELAQFSRQLIIYFLSMFKCAGITDKTLETITIPHIYQRTLSCCDFVSLSNIFMKIPSINTDELVIINDPYRYLTFFIRKFNISDRLMEILLNGN